MYAIKEDSLKVVTIALNVISNSETINLVDRLREEINKFDLHLQSYLDRAYRGDFSYDPFEEHVGYTIDKDARAILHKIEGSLYRRTIKAIDEKINLLVNKK